MRISDIRVTHVKLPRADPTWRTASYAANSVDGFFLEIVADGQIGIGGTAAHPSNISAADLEAELNGPVRTALLGADPLAGNVIRQKIAEARVHTRVSLAADLALHDLTGKLAKLPCYALWGGAVRLQVPVVRMVGIKAPEVLEQAVGGMTKEGYTHFKVKIGTGISEDVERIRILRNAFGDKIWMGVDGNGAYSPDDAVKLSHALEPYDVRLIEQPINYRDLEGMAKVTANSKIAIMADQNVNNAKSALKVCQLRAAHVVSVKATKMGSLDECRKVFDVCEAFGVRVHIGGSAGPGVVDVAQAHLAVSLPGLDAECEVGEFKAVLDDPTTGAKIRNGVMELNDAPGLGVGLNFPKD